MASIEDRSSINKLHLGTPAQLRDASGGGSVWKREPTKIATPTNSRTPNGNPYSSSRLGNTLNNARGGNLSARGNVVAYSHTTRTGPPPNKRARVDSSAPRSRKKVAQSSNSGGFRPHRIGDPDNTGVIYVDDEYEDVGERVQSGIQSDELDSLPPLRSVSLHQPRSAFYGPSTSKPGREKRVQERPPLAPEDNLGQDSDDPIEVYDEPANVQANGVQAKIKSFEEMDARNKPDSSIVRINFENLPVAPKANVKKSMKPKNPTAAPLENDRPKAIPASKPPDQAARKNPFLPMKAWYLGRKLFDEPYHLTWTAAGKLIIRSGDDPNAKAKHSEEIDISWFAQRVWFVEANEAYPDKVFVLETYEPFNNKKAGTQKPFGTQFSEFFKLGSKHAEGHVTIKFDSKSPAWADPFYAQFVGWLQAKVDTREKLRGKAGDAKWEAINRMDLITKAAEARIRRENGGNTASTSRNPARAKSPAVAGIPALDNWSPPAAIANTTFTRSKRQGSPGAPIEVDSPTRPSYVRPRMLNGKQPDSDTAGGGHEPPRRSARQSVAPQRPYVDPDEVILVYPPGQTGAVNITNGDVTRLAPGEFLNDTLIEFGLKLWLQDLERKDPELVKQIHVFSSFFYKKLNKKNPMEGYESVRKWTSKFDLFDKKYIIVPINENLHWYLAIIYHPEHTLKPPPATKSPVTRGKTRKCVEQSPELDQVPVSRRETSGRPPDSKASSVTHRTPSPMDTAAGGSGSISRDETLSPSSNVQAEAEVVNELISACSLAEDDADVAATDRPEDGDDRDSLFDGHTDDAMEVDPEESPESLEAAEEQPPVSNDGGSHTASEEPAEIMDVDAHVDPDESMDPLDLFADESSPRAVSEPVKAVSFYGSSTKSRGKRKATSPPLETYSHQEAVPSEVHEEEHDDGQPTTYIFTLDSLGTRHPKVVNVLGQYLKHEAQERKGIPVEMSSKPIGKAAPVPHQPNFCDCGIYLLHLAETFISDPSRYYNMIVTQKGITNSVQRQNEWRDDKTKTLRQSLADRIAELSVEWKKNRAAQKELKKTQEDVVPESSDDDVDIVDTTPAPPQKTPKTGKVMRMRG